MGPALSQSGPPMPFLLALLEDGCWKVNFLGLDQEMSQM